MSASRSFPVGQVVYAVLLAGAGACKAVSVLAAGVAVRLDLLAGSNR